MDGIDYDACFVAIIKFTYRRAFGEFGSEYKDDSSLFAKSLADGLWGDIFTEICDHIVKADSFEYISLVLARLSNRYLLDGNEQGAHAVSLFRAVLPFMWNPSLSKSIGFLSIAVHYCCLETMTFINEAVDLYRRTYGFKKED